MLPAVCGPGDFEMRSADVDIGRMAGIRQDGNRFAHEGGPPGHYGHLARPVLWIESSSA